MKKDNCRQQQIKLFCDILSDYEDIEMELEDSLQSYDILMTDIESAVGEINEELERIHNVLGQCKRKRAKLCGPTDLLLIIEAIDEQMELPIGKSLKSLTSGISD